MEKILIVAIFTPTTPARDRGVWGTGYPVANDHILTARHVIEPVDANTKKPTQVVWPIQVCWHHATEDRWVNIQKENVVWMGDGDLDAALIHCPRPKSLAHYDPGYVVQRMPGATDEWQSSGFARADKRNDKRPPGHYRGQVYTMAEPDPFFQIDVAAKPERKELWKGASGMPVFVGVELLGVVKEVPDNFNGQKLNAVPSWRLLKDKDFSAKLGIDDKERLEKSARELLHRLLKRSDEVTRSLAAALSGDLDVPDEQNLPCADMAHCREQVVDALLERPPALERLGALARKIQQQRQSAGDRDGAEVAADLMLALLPAIQDAGVVTGIRADKGSAAVHMIPLPAKLKMVAEIIMAGADRRAAKLRLPTAWNDYPEGEASLPAPPESGRDPNGEQYKRDWRTHLHRTFITEQIMSPDDSQPARNDMVNAELRQLASFTKTTYYFIADMRGNQAIPQAREDALKQVKEEFELIAFLRLEGTEPKDVEMARYGWLPKLMYQYQEFVRGSS
ncbi:MAG: hypothetical protein L0H63_13225 [Nitrococcus sp.]|nr:hypothetical protein [Nitrococcus sp.]